MRVYATCSECIRRVNWFECARMQFDVNALECNGTYWIHWNVYECTPQLNACEYICDEYIWICSHATEPLNATWHARCECNTSKMHVEYVSMQHNMNASVIECVLMHRTRNAVYVVQCACIAMHECACMRRNECNSMYMDAYLYMWMHLNAIC